MKVLILGVAGPVGRRLAANLHRRGFSLAGIDERPFAHGPRDMEIHRVDVRKRAAEEVFRRFRPDVVVHIGTSSAFAAASGERDRINLHGTRAVFEYCRDYGVKQAVFVGRHTTYGAGPDASLYHSEDEPPHDLARFPELADMVAADLYAVSELWRMPALVTTVLRLVYTLGPSAQGTLASFLRGRRVPLVLGYDPLFHFMHEDDAAAAIEVAIDKSPRGVFNVAGPRPLPISVIARTTGRSTLPLPGPLLAAMLGRAGLPRLSEGALNHLRYPVVVDDSAFRKATGFEHRYDEVATLKAFAAENPAT